MHLGFYSSLAFFLSQEVNLTPCASLIADSAKFNSISNRAQHSVKEKVTLNESDPQLIHNGPQSLSSITDQKFWNNSQQTSMIYGKKMHKICFVLDR